MADAQQKVVQYLNEAHATELALVRTLQAHAAVAPSGDYRSGLETHLAETKTHVQRIRDRLDELGASRSLVQLGVGVAQSAVGQALSLTKGPLDLVRGSSSEEKLLKNLKDECAAETLEIATYDAIELLARSVGDERTAELAVEIRADEERMLARLRDELPNLMDAVVRAEIMDDPSYDASTTGAAESTRAVANRAASTARRAVRRARGAASDTAREARKVPGVARAEGEARGAVASESDLAIESYDSLNADEVVSKLSGLSQVELGKVDAYESKNQNRTTVLDRIETLRRDEPWPGYDELKANEVRKELAQADEDLARQVRDYERRHKDRKSVLEVAERELAKAEA